MRKRARTRAATGSKYERQNALSAALAAAGFRRSGADHILDRGELQWMVFLSVVREERDVRFDISFSAADRELLDRGEFSYLVNQTVGLMPGASRRHYFGSDKDGAEPMIDDLKRVLLPVILRSSARAAVVDEWLSGTWGWTTDPRSFHIAHGLRLARDFRLAEQEARAEALVEEGDWSPTDRWYFKTQGVDIGGPYTDPTKPTFWDRLRGFS